MKGMFTGKDKANWGGGEGGQPKSALGPWVRWSVHSFHGWFGVFWESLAVSWSKEKAAFAVLCGMTIPVRALINGDAGNYCVTRMTKEIGDWRLEIGANLHEMVLGLLTWHYMTVSWMSTIRYDISV